MEIERINEYGDPRFSEPVLRQHGAFLVDGIPYEVEVNGRETAVVRGPDRALYPEVIDVFRFYAGHICRFLDEEGRTVREFPPRMTFPVKLSQIQPSQFYVDEAKLAAVKTFLSGPEDIIIPVLREGEGYISLDGHTRLAAAVDAGYEAVHAFLDEDIENIHGFVEEARKRGVRSPYDLKRVSHEDYKVLWDRFCDEYFAKLKE